MYESAAGRYIKRGIDARAVGIKVYRAVFGEFSEPCGKIFITEVMGQYYKGPKWRIVNDIAEKGTYKPRYREGFITAYTDDSMLIAEGDYFELDGKKYTVTDIYAEKNIYVDLIIVKAE